MWRFIKNLFKKKEPPTFIRFEYDNQTVVKAKKTLGEGLDGWEIQIDTLKSLTKKDFIKIIKELKSRTE